MKTKARAQHKSLVELHRILEHTIAENKEFKCEEVEHDEEPNHIKSDQTVKSKLDSLEKENSRLTSALTCSVCSNMVSLNLRFGQARFR